MFAVFVVFRFGLEVGDDSMELADELVAGVAAKDFVEPARVWFRVFGRDNLDDVALVEFSLEVDHFAVNFCASTGRANFAMETVGKI